MVGPRRAARKEGRGRLRAVKRFGVSFLDVGRGGKKCYTSLITVS